MINFNLEEVNQIMLELFIGRKYHYLHTLSGMMNKHQFFTYEKMEHKIKEEEQEIMQFISNTKIGNIQK